MSSFIYSSSPSSISTFNSSHEAIDTQKKSGKFIAKNRYCYDEKYDTPRNWPVWPSNIYVTAPQHLSSHLIFVPQPAIIAPEMICSSISSDDSIIYASNNSSEEEPSFKRIRYTESENIPDYGEEDNINQIDCDILSCFFSFSEDELLESDLFF